MRFLTPLIAAVLAAAVSGCVSIGPPHGHVDPSDAHLRSIAVRVPANAGWRGEWEEPNGPESRSITLVHAAPGSPPWDRKVQLLESPRSTSAPPSQLQTREQLLEIFGQGSRTRLGDPDATVEEVPIERDPRFGDSSVQIAVRAQESDARAAGRPKRSIFTAVIRFHPPAPSPVSTSAVVYQERGELTRFPPQGWTEFRAWVSPRESEDPSGGSGRGMLWIPPDP